MSTAVLFLFAFAPAGAAVISAPLVLSRQPEPGAQVRTFFPILSARIEHADANSLHLFVDGTDVTGSMSVNGQMVEYTPKEHMQAGWHDVFLEGTGRNNQPFSNSWAFQTQAPDGQFESSPDPQGFEFLPIGRSRFFPGNFMHFFFVAPTDGFAVLQLCGFGQFPFEHQPFSPVFFVTVPVTFTPFNPFANCQVATLFTPLTGFDTVFVPLLIPIAVFPNAHYAAMNPRMTLPVYRTTLPVYRTQETPVQTSPVMPGFTRRGTMPVYRVQPMPGSYGVQYSPRMGAPAMRPIAAPRPIAMPHPIAMPRPITMPRPIPMPMPHPIAMPHPIVHVPH